MRLKYTLSFNQHNIINESLVFEAANETIRAIQAALKAKGSEYANMLGTSGPNKDGVDGVYGTNTKNAIKKFQAANGIAQTGFVGKLTAPKLGVSPMSSTPQTKTVAPKTPTAPTAPKLPQLDLTPKHQTSSTDTVDPYARRQDTLGQAKHDEFSKSQAALNFKITIGDKGENVNKIQQKLIELGHLKISAPTGNYQTKTASAVMAFQKANGLTANGIVDKLTYDKLFASPTQSTTPVQTTQWNTVKASDQVKRQIQYLQTNNLLKANRFTILDDINSLVYTVNPNYQLLKVYPVITGEKVGDAVATTTVMDFVKTNWQTVFGKIFKEGPKSAVDYIDSEYFNIPQMKAKVTPAGVFRRVGIVTNWLYDTIATGLVEKDYGKRYIGFQNLAGKTIPFGFHGTQSQSRMNVLDKDANAFSKNGNHKRANKNNISYGCINFKESDIIEISKFIKAGDYSIWLPDENTNILDPRNGQQVTV